MHIDHRLVSDAHTRGLILSCCDVFTTPNVRSLRHASPGKQSLSLMQNTSHVDKERAWPHARWLLGTVRGCCRSATIKREPDAGQPIRNGNNTGEKVDDSSH